MKRINISHVGNEHNRWLRALNFYKTEIGILKGILTEVAGKNTDREAMKEVEHFENQFRVQADNIDRLSHDIHVNIATIARQLQQPSAGYIDGELLAGHGELEKRYEIEEKIVLEIVHSFRRFAEKWM